ncbi:MAG: hypothetical protein R3B06_23770 [Kofleriaceae bacterium]
MRTSTMLSTCLALALATTACGDGGTTPALDAGADAGDPLDAAPRQVVDDTRTLGAGEIIEATMTGGPGDRVVMHLTASAPDLDWNIHGHAGSGTQTVAEAFKQSVVDYAFLPSAQADWFLLLRNSGTAPIDVTIHVELYGAITWSGLL